MNLFMRAMQNMRKQFYLSKDELFKNGREYVKSEVAEYGDNEETLDRLYDETANDDKRNSFDDGMLYQLQLIKIENGYPNIPRTVVTDSSPSKPMPNPTEADLEDPIFNAIYKVIRRWDVNAPEYYAGYCGANGSHAKLIFDAIYNDLDGMIESMQRLKNNTDKAINTLKEMRKGEPYDKNIDDGRPE